MSDMLTFKKLMSDMSILRKSLQLFLLITLSKQIQDAVGVGTPNAKTTKTSKTSKRKRRTFFILVTQTKTKILELPVLRPDPQSLVLST